MILNHSPYSLENRWLENGQPGHHQTGAARQKTFENFCKLMATNSKYCADGDGLVSPEEQKKLLDTMALPRKEFNNSWYSTPLNQRNNFGKVYNYFCPNDGTVSLLPIQGFGWSSFRTAASGYRLTAKPLEDPLPLKATLSILRRPMPAGPSAT